ncbi:class III extradiol ring-cleavage dioxygenase [Methylosoma difficile]
MNSPKNRLAETMPVLFVPHGGGPMPLLDEPNHRDLALFLKAIPLDIPRPKAILVITAHWEEETATVSRSEMPGMIYDYHGFPPAAYQFKYPAAGSPELADAVAELLNGHGIASKLDSQRGFDHGTFVPLMLMYPLADIPVVQLSLVSSLNPNAHIAIGKALASLRKKGVLILGSGMSFHNMSAFFSADPTKLGKSEMFDAWLSETLMNKTMGLDEQAIRLSQWASAPEARFCHPREEHLLPLLVCFGAGSDISTEVSKVFSGKLFNTRISGYLWE